MMSCSPTWPAHSKLDSVLVEGEEEGKGKAYPSMERKSTPSLTADCAWRMVVHLWRMMQPAAFNILMTGPGELPAVSTTLIPSSMTT